MNQQGTREHTAISLTKLCALYFFQACFYPCLYWRFAFVEDCDMYVIDRGEGNTVQYTPKRRSREGVYQVRYCPKPQSVTHLLHVTACCMHTGTRTPHNPCAAYMWCTRKALRSRWRRCTLRMFNPMCSYRRSPPFSAEVVCVYTGVSLLQLQISNPGVLL